MTEHINRLENYPKWMQEAFVTDDSVSLAIPIGEIIKGAKLYPKVLTDKQIKLLYRVEMIDFCSWYLRLWYSLREVWLVLIGR